MGYELAQSIDPDILCRYLDLLHTSDISSIRGTCFMYVLVHDIVYLVLHFLQCRFAAVQVSRNRFVCSSCKIGPRQARMGIAEQT